MTGLQSINCCQKRWIQQQIMIAKHIECHVECCISQHSRSSSDQKGSQTLYDRHYRQLCQHVTLLNGKLSRLCSGKTLRTCKNQDLYHMPNFLRADINRGTIPNFSYPRIGAFEVSLVWTTQEKGLESDLARKEILIFSKILSQKWPNMKDIAGWIGDIFFTLDLPARTDSEPSNDVSVSIQLEQPFLLASRSGTISAVVTVIPAAPFFKSAMHDPPSQPDSDEPSPRPNLAAALPAAAPRRAASPPAGASPSAPGLGDSDPEPAAGPLSRRSLTPTADRRAARPPARPPARLSAPLPARALAPPALLALGSALCGEERGASRREKRRRLGGESMRCAVVHASPSPFHPFSLFHLPLLSSL